MFKKLTVVAAVVGLTGCATGNYELYAQTQRSIAEAQAQAEIARVAALAEIAKTGDTAARVAAVMSIQQAGSNNNNSIVVRQPESVGDQILKWTSVILPSVTQIYGISKNTDVAITNSNNSRDVSINNNRSMVDMGRLIAGQEAPVVGGPNDQLIWPQPPVVGTQDDVLLFPK
jgi:hypothetical protein